MKAVKFLIWLVIFLALYSGFFVLFQYGPKDVVEGAKIQLEEVKTLQ